MSTQQKSFTSVEILDKPRNIMSPSPQHTSTFVRAMRRVYRPLGFQKGYNFPLFIIFAGAMLGFVLARLSYLNIGGSASSSFASGASPGEWFHYHEGLYRVGITLHLASCLPMGFLMIWQFVPVIRHKLLIFHRINGYLVMLLCLVSNAGALIIAPKAFGGGLDVRSGTGMLAILTTGAFGMAYYNIKRLQIDQHRAWMLRAMFYLGTIITARLVLILSALITTKIGGFYQILSCDEVAFIQGSYDTAVSLYPQCANMTGNAPLVVSADFNGQPESIGASLQIGFGMGLWIAIFLHTIGIEIYLNLTPAEAEKLRGVSYERQLEAGFENPGSSGLTVDRWGDAEAWKPVNRSGTT
ncbi:hypothetical protein LSUE1_G009294 [Lachnellula suecica]|uniref:Uncharacterized protein n=1 Tax=Lachnellula suecica TaxID=602035 RepID=A0A8T9BW20_9HELO|nr:hypothetical protein LSUE1_G009294 [Lachnellula suecica]